MVDCGSRSNSIANIKEIEVILIAINTDTGDRLKLQVSEKMYKRAMSTNSEKFIDITTDDDRVFVVRRRENGARQFSDLEAREVH